MLLCILCKVVFYCSYKDYGADLLVRSESQAQLRGVLCGTAVTFD